LILIESSSNLAGSSTLQFPDIGKLNQRFMVATSDKRGSKQESHQKW